MAISEKVKSFRLERASELDQFARVLKKIGNCDPYPLNNAADQLRNFTYVPKIKQEDEVNYNYWGYDTGNLTFWFEHIPRHTYPENPVNLSLNLSVKLIADYEAFKKMSDPYVYLEVNISVTGTYLKSDKSIELITSFHLYQTLSSTNNPNIITLVFLVIYQILCFFTLVRFQNRF